MNRQIDTVEVAEPVDIDFVTVGPSPFADEFADYLEGFTSTRQRSTTGVVWSFIDADGLVFGGTMYFSDKQGNKDQCE